MALSRPTLAALSTILLSACATAPETVRITSEASASPYFSLGAPQAYKVPDGMRMAGRVCRRALTTSLSPPRIRLEHIIASGEATDVAHASVPAIMRSSDQACRTYSTKVNWQLADGDTVRACFDRGRPCPAGSARAVIAAPATATLNP